MLKKYTTIGRIFDMVNDFKPGFNENDIIKWTGRALEQMKVPKLFEQALCYMEVQNYQASIPEWTHNIIQIVKDVLYEPVIASSGICPINILTDTTEVPSETVPLPSCGQLPAPEGNPVIVDELGQPMTEYDLVYYKPYFDLKYDYLSWINTNMYKSRFAPVRLSNHHFFNTIVCEESKDIPYSNCDFEYTIIGGEILRFNFKDGGVIVAYERQQVDADGVPLIPDVESVISAIEFYIRWRYAIEDFDSQREGSQNRLQKWEEEWQWYCKQAKNELFMPSSVDEWQNLLEGRNYLVPRDNYYGFFGHLGKKESRRYLTNTNRR